MGGSVPKKKVLNRGYMARSGLEVQQAVIKALFMREIKTRFGKYRLGYLWAVLEPAAHLMVMVGIFGYVMHRTMPDISYHVFLVNGIIPYFIFSDVTNRSISAIEANQGLFNYRPVKPIDTVIARSLLEFFIYLFVYVTLMTILWMLGEDIIFPNVTMLILIWGLLLIFSASIGVIFMVIGNLFPETEKFLPIIIKPFYFISCVMFPLHAVPKDYWGFLLWNPIVHIVELTRGTVVTGYSSEEVSLNYLFIVTLVVLFIGVILYEYREEKMLTS